jgi:hypothetical protein
MQLSQESQFIISALSEQLAQVDRNNKEQLAQVDRNNKEHLAQVEKRSEENFGKLYSELQLIKHGIAIIGGKPVSDLYGMTLDTKSEIETQAEELIDSGFVETVPDFVQKCDEDPKFRKEQDLVTVVAVAEQLTGEKLKAGEKTAIGKWVHGMIHKCLGVTFNKLKNSKVNERRMSATYYPRELEPLLNSLAYYYFMEREDAAGKKHQRMY